MSLIYWIRYAIFRFALWMSRATRLSRFEALYDYYSKDPEKYGIFYPKEELDYEQPLKCINRKQDGVEFFMQNSKGDILFATITRMKEGICSMCLHLRLSDGSSYNLQKVEVDMSNEETFICAGLRIEVVQSMRRWRISFNGTMAEVSTGEAKHIRLIFIGNLITGCGDYKSFHNESFLARQLALNGTSLSTAIDGNINKALNDIDIYTQTFTMSGKVFVENREEEEVYLWGYRRRFRDTESTHLKTLLRITAYTENGLSFDLNRMEIKKFSKNFLFGHLGFPALQERPLENCSLEIAQRPSVFYIGAGEFLNLKVNLGKPLESISTLSRHNGRWHKSTVTFSEINYDSNRGYAMIRDAVDERPIDDLIIPEVPRYIRQFGRDDPEWTKCRSNVLKFADKFCDKVELTGGKGSSLAVLTKISVDRQKFAVPQGVCVTTNAYRSFTAIPAARKAIDKLMEFCSKSPSIEDLKNMCRKVTTEIEQCDLPSEVKDNIRHELTSLFSDSAATKKFAVRSSGCGEDCEEMSAAGQNQTFLGVEGWDNIFRSVTKCWASQFSFVAVQYKRRYGQLIDGDMCVVIQEMVRSDVSGVMFTVDPVTSNPKVLTITANFGLGESVVSAAADPDTFIVDRNSDGTLSIKEVQLGAKKLSTIMLESGGTEDIVSKESRSSEQCLTNDQILEVARVGVILEKSYAAPRDTEWAIYKDKLYMLQARPVTSGDNIDNEFEFFHETDGGLVSEFDSFSKANTGEVFGGSIAPMTLDVFRGLMSGDKREAIEMNSDFGRSHYARHELIQGYGSQIFFATYSALADYTADDIISKGFSIAMAGRVIDDECVLKSNANKRRYQCKGGRKPGLVQLIKDIWHAESNMEKGEKAVQEYVPDFSRCRHSMDILNKTFEQPVYFSEAGNGHMKVITYGTINNIILLATLANSEGDWNNNVYSDFAELVSSCNNVVSAGVPQGLQKISEALQKEYKDLTGMNPEELLTMLGTGNNESSRLFKLFLKEHGHRSLHEFDLITKTWEMNPLPVVKTVQSMLSAGLKKGEESENFKLDDVMKKMNIKMNFVKRFFLKFILERVRRGISMRERTKSALVMANNLVRRNLRVLANKMVEEGRLDDPDLLFFLIPHELKRLIETRSPKLIVKANLRMKNAKTAGKDRYPEHTAGLPLIPVNRQKPIDIPPGGKSMNGTPVSKGVVTATARVVMDLEEAGEIQKGDILITYATDIGWSPYFPLLGGIVTELGGLISHGAVVAREFGLPCVVGMHGATQLFKSGEKVLLDGTKGILCTIEDNV